MYTSKEFGKQLKNGGCELESEKIYLIEGFYLEREGYIASNNEKTILINKTGHLVYLTTPEKWQNDIYVELDEYIKDNKEDVIPAYDILNDVCVKYAKEFFGEYNPQKNPRDGSESPNLNGVLQITREILSMLQQNKPQEEIEKYIWDNCKFNPKNK